MSEYEAHYDDVPSVLEEKPKEKTPSKKEDEVIDEVETLKVEQEVEGTPSKKEKTPTKTEDKGIEEAARAQGWVPLEEWEGDPAQWRDADVFLERGEYFSKMSAQNKKIKQLNKELNEMSRQFTKMREQERQKAIEELKQEKARAIEDEEYNKVVEIDEKINETNKEAEEEIKNSKEEAQRNHDEMLQEFVAQNPWYAENKDMKAYADRLAAGYAAVEGTEDMSEILEYVVAEVKSRYGDTDYFQDRSSYNADEYEDADERSTPRKKSSPVGTSNTSSSPSRSASRGRNKKASASDLNDMQRRVGQRFVDSEAMKNLDEYAVELQKIGELD